MRVYARCVTMGKGGERGLPPKKNGDVLSYLARPALVRPPHPPEYSTESRASFCFACFARAELLRAPYPSRAARSQDNFDFFERAVAFLRTASDDELAACAATYARFLRTAANSDGRSANGVPCFAAELCWRVHLLSPFIYAKYCRKNFKSHNYVKMHERWHR